MVDVSQELALCLFEPMRSNVVAQCLLLDCCAVAGRWADALSIFEHLEPSKELWWVHGGKVSGLWKIDENFWLI